MLEHQGFTNRLVRQLGQLVLSYVNHYYLQVADGKEAETGSAIAFCHGRGGTPYMYSSFLLHFAAQGFRVGAVQHTEIGETGLKGKEVIKKFREREVQVRAAEYYQTVVEVAKGKQRLVLMGHSYGCATVIQAYHSLDPELKAKVSQIILLDPWFFPLNETKFAQEISCPVLILANEDFLMNPDMYRRNVAFVGQHKL
jgi:pimeloyl-ACP methyl ester carboxylesterase